MTGRGSAGTASIRPRIVGGHAEEASELRHLYKYK